MTLRPIVRTTFTLGLALGLASGAARLDAQTLYGYDGGAAAVVELSGPPVGPCGYPAGPIASIFPAIAPFPCVTAGPVLPPPPAGLLGDIAVDKLTDTIYVTDGLVITQYTPAGVPIASVPVAPGAIVPGPLTSLGFGGGVLWISDGAFVAGLAPFPPGCFAVPPIVVPPWPAGVPFVTDVAFDPFTGTLWACTAGGAVANLIVGGGVGPIFPVVGFCAPALVAPLTGIAYDSATPTFAGAPPVISVTNGFVIARLALPPGPAAPTFYAPLACTPVPAGPLAGLASSLHGIAYGAGFDPTGLPAPVMASVGQSTTPSATFGFTLAGAAPFPGTAAALFVDFAALCPPLVGLGGNPIYALPTLLIGPFPVLGGALALPAPIPPTPFIGLPIFAQWIVVKGGGGFQVSNGLEFTIGLP